jgi:hypothetical protein
MPIIASRRGQRLVLLGATITIAVEHHTHPECPAGTATSWAWRRLYRHLGIGAAP